MSARWFADTLLRAWPHRGLLAWALRPISWVYGTLLLGRRLGFQTGLFKSRQVAPVVLVVGNVIVGGAGKTPTTMRIVRHLQAQNYRVGVISRGYGRKQPAPRLVQTGLSAAEVGDEPLLIHTATGAPTAVAARRLEAAHLLLQAHPDLQILVCDDGLQHYALYRDVEVCVFDDRGVGNGWLLPAGPLREPWPLQPLLAAGQRSGGPLLLNTGRQSAGMESLLFQAQRRLSQRAISSSGESLDLHTGLPPNRPIAAIAGIARPEIFFAMLREMGIPLALTLALADHARLDPAQLEPFKNHTLLCTEKDAGKIWPIFASALAVPLNLDIEPAFFEALDHRVQAAIRAKLSSRHGHTTS